MKSKINMKVYKQTQSFKYMGNRRIIGLNSKESFSWSKNFLVECM